MIVISNKLRNTKHSSLEKASQAVMDDLVPVEDKDFIAPVNTNTTNKNIQEDHWIWKPDIQHTFLPKAPAPDPEKMPIPPENILSEEFITPPDPKEAMSVRELIVESLNTTTPLNIFYVTLDGLYNSERVVHPDYVYWSGTNRHILVAWDELKSDWRAFAIDNIRYAKLMEEPWL